MTLLEFVNNISRWKYLFWHWLYSWNVDKEGDIVFSVAKILHFVKYKEHTLVQFGHKNYDRAAKWIEAREIEI